MKANIIESDDDCLSRDDGVPCEDRAECTFCGYHDWIAVPRVSSDSLNDFLLTVHRTGGDVELEALDTLTDFVVIHCTSGVVSVVGGMRNFTLHC